MLSIIKETVQNIWSRIKPFKIPVLHKQELLFVRGRIGEIEGVFILDTGCTTNILAESKFPRNYFNNCTVYDTQEVSDFSEKKVLPTIQVGLWVGRYFTQPMTISPWTCPEYIKIYKKDFDDKEALSPIPVLGLLGRPFIANFKMYVGKGVNKSSHLCLVGITKNYA